MKYNNEPEIIEHIFTISRMLKDNMCYNTQLLHLSLLQLQALSFLKQHNNAQMKEIATHFNIELSSATSLLDKLHSMKLVKRKEDDHDRRLVRVMLTKPGELLLSEAMNERAKKITFILSHLTESERKQLCNVLRILRNRLEQINEK